MWQVRVVWTTFVSRECQLQYGFFTIVCFAIYYRYGARITALSIVDDDSTQKVMLRIHIHRVFHINSPRNLIFERKSISAVPTSWQCFSLDSTHTDQIMWSWCSKPAEQGFNVMQFICSIRSVYLRCVILRDLLYTLANPPFIDYDRCVLQAGIWSPHKCSSVRETSHN